MAKQVTGNKKIITPVRHRTSIGGNAKPTNKHKRRNFKPYRGQGRV